MTNDDVLVYGSFEGRVTDMNVGGYARIETDLGNMLADFDDGGSWYPKIQVGDQVSCFEACVVFKNGHVISWPSGSVTINGSEYDFEEWAIEKARTIKQA